MSTGDGRGPQHAAAVTGLLALVLLIGYAGTKVSEHEHAETPPASQRFISIPVVSSPQSSQPATKADDKSESESESETSSESDSSTKEQAETSTESTPETTPSPPSESKPQPAKPTKTAPPLVSVNSPTRILVPKILVNAMVEPLKDENGQLPTPEEFEKTGWWQAGPEPGAPGPAIIVGHADSRTGPAVFFRLRELHIGDEISIQRKDGTTATFVIEKIEQHDNKTFPTQAVYGSTEDPQLRLVTSGGKLDEKTGQHVDNVIVYARLQK